MNFKKIMIVCLTSVFALAASGKERAASQISDNVKNEAFQLAMRANNQNYEDQDDPNEVFSQAIIKYKSEFKDYLNVTALNVQDKENVQLPNFDLNYIVPEFFDIMYDYQIKLEMSLTSVQLQKYESLREQDYSFDRYVSLNANKFSTLEPSLKYNHAVIPINPNNPITPANPTIETVKGASIERTAVILSSSILTILANAGLSETIISAFTACISTITTGLSTSWIPLVGWALATALVAGALIAITVIVVQNWSKIKNSIEKIKTWFLEQFSKFASLIETFFEDAIAQGNESTVAYRKEVDGRVREFVDTEITTEVLSKIVDDSLKNNTVYLLGHIGDPEKGQYWWICYDTTRPDVVINEKLYNFGICTYTWYNNTAKRMMAFGSVLQGDYSSLIYERPDKGTALVHGEENLIGWNHYHLGHKIIKNGIYVVGKYETAPLKWAHSMFGKLCYRIEGGDDYAYYPEGNLN